MIGNTTYKLAVNIVITCKADSTGWSCSSLPGILSMSQTDKVWMIINILSHHSRSANIRHIKWTCADSLNITMQTSRINNLGIAGVCHLKFKSLKKSKKFQIKMTRFSRQTIDLVVHFFCLSSMCPQQMGTSYHVDTQFGGQRVHWFWHGVLAREILALRARAKKCFGEHLSFLMISFRTWNVCCVGGTYMGI